MVLLLFFAYVSNFTLNSLDDNDDDNGDVHIFASLDWVVLFVSAPMSTTLPEMK